MKNQRHQSAGNIRSRMLTVESTFANGIFDPEILFSEAFAWKPIHEKSGGPEGTERHALSNLAFKDITSFTGTGKVRI